jgi:ABC-2 type transport system permease protein
VNASTASAAVAIAKRHLYKWITVPSNFLPTFIFPLIFFSGFAGALGNVGKVPGFDYEPGYTSWIFVFSLLQTCMFGGLATGFTIAGDFQSGFARRLMLTVVNRNAILYGYVLSTFLRASVMSTLVTLVALVAGLELAGEPLQLAGMYVLALTMSIVGTMWAAGVMFRARNPQLGPAMQIPMFIAIFIAPVFVPLDLLEGWLASAAAANPVTYIMQTARDLLAGTPPESPAALVAVGALLVASAVWALTGVRSAERAGA